MRPLRQTCPMTPRWIKTLGLLLALTCAQTLQAQETTQPTRAEVMERVFLTAQSAQTSVAGKALSQAAARIAAGSEDLAALLRERQDTVDGLQVLIDQLAETAQESGIAAENRVTTLEFAINGARARIKKLDRTLEQDFPEFRELTNPAPLTFAELRSLLRPDEALLMSFTDQSWTYVWAISPDGADWHRADFGDQSLEDMVQTLRRQLSVTEDNRAGKALKKKSITSSRASFDRQTAHRIYKKLFQPLEHVFGGASHLMLVVDGPMTSLPPAVLVTQPPENGTDPTQSLRDTDWMIRHHALTTLPTVSALRTLRRARPPERKGAVQPFLGFGDPVLGYRLTADAAAALDSTQDTATETVVTRGIYNDVTQVADLAPLPNTSRELRRLAETMGVGEEALYLSRAATETAVKQADLSKAEVLAFATHGLLADGLPGLTEPALVFTPPDQPSAVDDALLTASEAAELKLSAKLVILSACDTAGSDGTPGAEGLSGLARAFIYAGARAILVSHWPVDDYAASALTTGMLERMQGAEDGNEFGDPATRAQALRASTLALMADPREARFAHPRIWAPFVVVGEGGAD